MIFKQALKLLLQ